MNEEVSKTLPAAKKIIPLKSAIDYKMLISFLDKRSFFAVPDLNDQECLFEQTAISKALLQLERSTIKTSEERIRLFFKFCMNEIETMEENFIRSEMHEKLITKIFELYSVKFHPHLSEFYLQIGLTENAIEYSNFVILIGQLLSIRNVNDIPIDSTIKTNLKPFSKIVIIYHICPLNQANLFKNEVIRIYNNFQVINQSILGFEYFLLNGYNALFELSSTGMRKNF